ncbi:MAG: YkgJ family cysteine cluster protein [Gammaproteobacteria bacterium]|nr:YkgJ family cysteine cluster protein [Gammaproteobacteria bacterium]
MDNKCFRCPGTKCCSYTTEALGVAPRSKADFDHLLWQISHQGMEIYKDEGEWYLMFHGSCEHIQADGACGIYEIRPQICRDYENAWCEYDAQAEGGFELHFKNHAELLAYCKTRFKQWRKYPAITKKQPQITRS